MRKSRRILLMTLVLTMGLLLPLGATAGAKPKPPDPTHYVQLTLVGNPAGGYFDGLATTCEGPILMVEGPGGRLGAGGAFGGDDPNLWIEAQGLQDIEGEPLTGCYGDAISEVPYPGQLMITRDVSGDPTEIKFWFDAVAERVVTIRGKKVIEEIVLQSRYTLVSTALTPMNDVASGFEGTFELWFWTSTPEGGDNNQYLGAADLQFTFEVSP